MKTETEKYLLAKERVHKIKGFYTHLTLYILINTILTFINIYFSGFERIHFNMFSTWLFWGIGIFFHAIGVFGKNLIFSKDWENRKINELVNKQDEDIRF